MDEKEREKAVRKATEILENAGFNDYLIGAFGEEDVTVGGKGDGNKIFMILKAFGHQFPEIFVSLMIEELEKLNEQYGEDDGIHPQNTIPQ